MNLTFRPLPAWPYPPQKTRPDLFKASYNRTLEDLEREIGYLGGDEIIVGLVVAADQIRLDGRMRADARVNHPGVELSFEKRGRLDPITNQRAPGERLVFHTDVHSDWRSNLRAIALGLESLRAVDRYGITSTAEQYAGFLQLETSQASAARGKELVDAAGSVKAALLEHHPDHGGDPHRFADVQAYRQGGGG